MRTDTAAKDRPSLSHPDHGSPGSLNDRFLIVERERRVYLSIALSMDRRKVTARLGPPIVSRLGAALRDLTKDAACAEQPPQMRCALAALRRLGEREQDRPRAPTRRS
jgi:hypothetical protein